VRLSILRPFAKHIARRLVVRCEKCGKERLLSAFEVYSGNGAEPCAVCSLNARLAKPLIGRFFKEMSVNEEVGMRIVSEPLIARAMLNTVRGIAHFGIRTPQPAGAPVVIVWNFTNRCNLNCLHCHQDSSDMPVRSELSTTHALRVVDNMADAGVSILTFSGGEPMVRSDLYEVARYASDRGIFCTIATNGTLITEDVPERLYRAGIRGVEIGLDGLNAETHDFLRNAPGCFDDAVQGLKNCMAFGRFRDVGVAATLFDGNVEELPGLIDMCERLGVTRFYLNRILPAGRGKGATNLDVSPEVMMEVLEVLADRFIRAAHGNGMICYARGMTYFACLCHQRSNEEYFPVSEALSGYDMIFEHDWMPEIRKIINNLADGFGGCSAGLTYAGLTAGGELIPCVPSTTELGSLLEHDLKDLWLNNEILNNIRDREALTGTCGRCTYSGICGGCRYTAYEALGDWLGPDVSCPYGAKMAG